MAVVTDIVYLPEPAIPSFQSFAAPLLKVHDSRITTPYFGPNGWIALVQPVTGGGIPSQHPAVEAKLTFKDGGAYDFQTKFVRIKERLQQAADIAAESGQAGPAASQTGGANMHSVHLDQLPVYEERPSNVTSFESAEQISSSVASSTQTSAAAPDEPPPGYEEVQRGTVVEQLTGQPTTRH
ncbi:MAG: hypothetical protein Q9159_001884 [Coniocarpon cinnabarinum]